MRHVVLASLLLAVALPAGAQDVTRWTDAMLVANGELERYLRVLQSSADVPLDAWSSRSFLGREVERLRPASESHPWAGQFQDTSTSGMRALGASVRVSYNTGFAFGGNEWGVWQGRGTTLSTSGGFSYSAGPLSVILAPQVYIAENRAFALMRVNDSTQSDFADPLFSDRVDKVQRFGDERIVRVLPGQSAIMLRSRLATVGVSSANLWWGPADQFPLILSTNAPGFPHFFLSSGTPLRTPLGDLQGRYVFGQVRASDYYRPVSLSRRRNSTNGLLLALSPRGVRGLELGVARFFETPWPDYGLRVRDFTRVFQTPIKSQIAEDTVAGTPEDRRSRDAENQIASVFARWVSPHGLEIYAELGREDHPWDVRELVVLPDRQSSVLYGIRRTWSDNLRRRSVLRLEQMSFLQPSASRNGFGLSLSTYAHGGMGSTQGHTNAGMLLGSYAGVGNAAGAVVGYDRYSHSGRTTFSLTRVVQRDFRQSRPDSSAQPRAYDTYWVATAERLRFFGSGAGTVGVDYVYNFNRYFLGDVQNIRVRFARSW